MTLAPKEPDEIAERKDRLRYYAEQRRLRRLELEAPLSDFDEAALWDCEERLLKPILSIDKELK